MAQIYFGINNLEIPVGSTFEVGVFLDSEGESIAGAESTIYLPPNLELVDIRDGNSVVNLWLERPSWTEQGIRFSGITPSGFKGDHGELMILVVKAVTADEGTIDATQTKLLLNDGKGTPAEVSPAPLGFTTVAEGEVVDYQAPEDVDPPEDFTPLLVNEPQFGGWVVVFATQDKGSGVAYYELKEGWGSWHRATSPWLLNDQGLDKNIKVKAVDEAGNVRTASLEASQPQNWYEQPVFWGILLAVLVLAVVAVKTRRLWRRAKRSGQK